MRQSGSCRKAAADRCRSGLAGLPFLTFHFRACGLGVTGLPLWVRWSPVAAPGCQTAARATRGPGCRPDRATPLLLCLRVRQLILRTPGFVGRPGRPIAVTRRRIRIIICSDIAILNNRAATHSLRDQISKTITPPPARGCRAPLRSTGQRMARNLVGNRDESADRQKDQPAAPTTVGSEPFYSSATKPALTRQTDRDGQSELAKPEKPGRNAARCRTHARVKAVKPAVATIRALVEQPDQRATVRPSIPCATVCVSAPLRP